MIPFNLPQSTARGKRVVARIFLPSQNKALTQITPRERTPRWLMNMDGKVLSVILAAIIGQGRKEHYTWTKGRLQYATWLYPKMQVDIIYRLYNL